MKRALLMLLALLVGPIGVASAQATGSQRYGKAKFVERGGNLEASMSFTNLFDERSYTDLSSGFPTTVALRIYVYQKGNPLPVQLRVRRLRVVYDLWEEVYVVRIDDGDGHWTRKYESRVDVLQAIGRIKGLRLSPLSKIAVGPHYFMAIVAELNPVNDETLAEMRRWLRRSQSNQQADDRFFGSFVSVFSNTKLRKAERVLRIRSQPFYRRQVE